MRRFLRGLWVPSLVVGSGLGACGTVNKVSDAGTDGADPATDGPRRDGPGPDGPPSDGPLSTIDAPPPACAAPVSWPSTMSWINIFEEAQGHAGPDTSCGVVGSSTPSTNPQYVWCRRWGGEVRRGADFNHWWLWTDLDNPPSSGVRGWISAFYIQDQGNDEAKDINTGRDIPDCP